MHLLTKRVDGLGPGGYGWGHVAGDAEGGDEDIDNGDEEHAGDDPVVHFVAEFHFGLTLEVEAPLQDQHDSHKHLHKTTKRLLFTVDNILSRPVLKKAQSAQSLLVQPTTKTARRTRLAWVQRKLLQRRGALR